MIISASLVGPGDHVWLPNKFAVMAKIGATPILLIDRNPSAEKMAQAAGVDYKVFQSTPVPQVNADGVNWNEGATRQALWDWAMTYRPEWVLLTDCDEAPAPGICEFLASEPEDSVDCWYAPWVNLLHDAGHAIGGTRSVWSFQNPDTNKKGMMVRVRQGAEYRYRINATRHVRMEPSPLSEDRTLYDDRHKLGPVPLLHYRWAAWERWSRSEQARRPYWHPWPKPDAEIVEIPRSLLWQWSATELLQGLPEPIAVVGNGTMRGCGPAIDACRTVVRLNNWRSEGYEPHVGCRTDVWCTSCWDNVEMREWTGRMFTVYHDECQKGRISRWLGQYPHMAVPCARWYPEAQRMKNALGTTNPSTGLILLAKLAEMGKTVHAFGFDGLRSGHYWNPQHEHAHDDELPALMKLADRIRFR